VKGKWSPAYAGYEVQVQDRKLTVLEAEQSESGSNPKFWILQDLHYREKTGNPLEKLPSWVGDGTTYYQTIINNLEYATAQMDIDSSIKAIIINGDFLECIYDPNPKKELIETIHGLIAERKLYLLPGNHDDLKVLKGLGLTYTKQLVYRIPSKENTVNAWVFDHGDAYDPPVYKKISGWFSEKVFSPQTPHLFKQIVRLLNIPRGNLEEKAPKSYKIRRINDIIAGLKKFYQSLSVEELKQFFGEGWSRIKKVYHVMGHVHQTYNTEVACSQSKVVPQFGGAFFEDGMLLAEYGPEGSRLMLPETYSAGNLHLLEKIKPWFKPARPTSYEVAEPYGPSQKAPV